MRRRSSLTVTLALITSPMVLGGCGRSYNDGNVPHSGGGGFHFSGGGGSFRGGSGSFRGGGGGVGHASPSGGFGGFGHFGGGG